MRSRRIPKKSARSATIPTPEGLYVHAKLLNKETGEWTVQMPGEEEKGIFMAELPKMTDSGTFIINGAERVIVSQLVRPPAFTTPRPSIRPASRSMPLPSSPAAAPG